MDSSASSLSDTLRKDQRERWRRGERVLVESYVERFPALASDPILPSGCLVMFNRAFKAFMTGTNTAMRKPTRSRPWRG